MSDEVQNNDSDNGNANSQGVIKDVGMLDLRYAKTPEDLAHIRKIKDVGVVLVPEHLAGVLSRISMSDIGGVVPIPQDGSANCLTGQIQVSAEMLKAGDPDTILIIVGQAFISGEVTSVGYKEIRVFGQMFAPRSSQEVISCKLTHMTGQNFFLPNNPRIFMGTESIGSEFLSLLDEPCPIVVMGTMTFERDVTKELLREKVSEIVLMGTIEAPSHLVPTLQILTKEKLGTITATE
ncbi:MAG: hypothetical protein P4L46_13595 [Fimbriimonas sp.]|nr:hypothetical protein [Fimbriimonas sp.]